MNIFWTLDKPMASLSTCHLGLLPWMAILLNLAKVLKFADDTKVFRKVTNDTDKQSLQDDLDKCVKWSEKWQMLLNFGKCKCIHIGHGNMDEEHKMGDAVLGRTTQENDLGVTFSADMKVSEQCGIAASK